MYSDGFASVHKSDAADLGTRIIGSWPTESARVARDVADPATSLVGAQRCDLRTPAASRRRGDGGPGISTRGRDSPPNLDTLISGFDTRRHNL